MIRGRHSVATLGVERTLDAVRLPTSPDGDPTADVTACRRETMHVAAGLFAAQGFSGTTTAQICDAAGISPGHLSHYFASKRDLFAAILTDDGSDATARALASARDAADPLVGLLDYVDHLAAAAAEPAAPGLVLEAMLQAVRDPELAERLGADSDAEEAGVRALLTRARDAGAIDPDVDLADTAAWIMAMVGAVYLSAATDDRFDPARRSPFLRLTVERLLTGGSTAQRGSSTID